MVNTSQVAYLRISSLGSHVLGPWDPEIEEEFLAATHLLPFVEGNIRARVASLLSATERAMSHTSACVAAVPKEVAGLRYHRNERRGEHVQLD